MWHEGQFEGRRVRVPVFLQRRPDEPPDSELAGGYRDLLALVASRRVRTGDWQLLEAGGWPDNQTCDNLLAGSWSGAGGAGGAGDAGDGGGDGDGADRHVIVVNLSLRLRPRGGSR